MLSPSCEAFAETRQYSKCTCSLAPSITPTAQEAVQPLMTVDSDDEARLHLLGKRPSPPSVPTGNACPSQAEGDCPEAGVCLPRTEAELKMRERNVPGRGPGALAVEVWGGPSQHPSSPLGKR